MNSHEMNDLYKDVNAEKSLSLTKDQIFRWNPIATLRREGLLQSVNRSISIL